MLAAARRRVPARHQRGPRRHRAVGHAAGRAARRGQVRRRVRHLVRQGPGRRPLRRRVPPRQFRRHLEARRRAGADGRRPHRGILHHRAPVRIPLRRRDDPDPQSGGRAGDHRLRPLRLGDVALHRRLGRRSSACTRRWRSTAVVDGSLDRVEDRHPGPTSRCRRAGSTSASATPSSAWRRGCTTTSATPCSPSSAPTSSTASSPPAAATRRSASSPPARAISTCARRSTSSASTRCSANDLGLRIYKIALPVAARASRSWRSSRKGLDLIIVVEEKRSLIEVQVREELYGTANQPACIGKKDEQRQLAVPGQGRARSQRRSRSASASGC